MIRVSWALVVIEDWQAETIPCKSWSEAQQKFDALCRLAERLGTSVSAYVVPRGRPPVERRAS